MTLLEELKDRADKLDAELLALSGRIKEVERESNELHTCINALDIAEMDEEDAEDEEESDHYFLHPNKPNLDALDFAAEKSEAREQLEREDDASEFAEPMPDPEFVALDEQTCEPVEEAPALNEQMQDEREEPVALAQPEWNEPRQSISMIDEQTCEPVDPTLRAFEDDHIVEPQPTEGYAPVTNPEADALAKAHDWYDPKAVADRNRFNPWGGVSHLFGKPKVDA